MRALTGRQSVQPDEDLLRGIGRGDRRALETLYLGYHRRLTRFLSRISPNFETIEEIINDTFMVVWQHAREFRGASRVSTWIIGIAYRIALKSLRRNDGWQHVQSLESVPELSVEPAADAELHDWIARAMQCLPIEQRLTMELAYTMGHSIEEIAAITECPVGTVKARMFHAREKLRKYLPMLDGTGASEPRTNP